MSMAEKKIWFKAKEYGYGWYPATWEGWLVTLGYVVVITVLAYIFEVFKIENFALVYLTSVFVVSGSLIYICYKTGEKAEWRWGNKIKK